jgi:hypothetical protein
MVSAQTGREVFATSAHECGIKSPDAIGEYAVDIELRQSARTPNQQLDQVKDSLHAYQLSKRGNSLRVMAEAVRWGKRGARHPDEVGAVAALLMGADGGFITGSDFLMDGGVTAAYWYGDVAEVRGQS